MGKMKPKLTQKDKDKMIADAQAKQQKKMKPKKKLGRPKWIPDEEILKQVETYGSLGMTSEQIAYCLGINPGTLSDKQNEFPAFYEAIKRGKAKGVAMVASELVKNVKNKNVTAQIFYLKCQAKWKETEVLEINDLSQAQALKEIE